MKILVSWSSGKDSAWTLHILRQQARDCVAGLLTSFNEVADRIAMHGVRKEIARAQAAAAGLPLIEVPLPSPCPNDVYETRMADVVRAAVDDGFTHVAFGDLFLDDVRRYREDRLAGTGLTPLFPLWGQPTCELARQIVAAGVEAWITCLDPRVMPRDLAGRRYDASLLDMLPACVDPCAERGEFHTCVTDGPMFSRPIHVEPGHVLEREGFVFADLRLSRPASVLRG